jgi:hypothetical protein
MNAKPRPKKNKKQPPGKTASKKTQSASRAHSAQVRRALWKKLTWAPPLRVQLALAASDLPAPARHLLSVYALHLNAKRTREDDDFCVWGGIRTIAAEMGVAKDTAWRWQQWCIKEGFLTVENGPHPLQKDSLWGTPSTCVEINIKALEDYVDMLLAGEKHEDDHDAA